MNTLVNKRVAISVVALAMMGGCATVDRTMGGMSQGGRTAAGAGAGAAVGAGLGALIGDSSEAALIGAGIGAVAAAKPPKLAHLEFKHRHFGNADIASVYKALAKQCVLLRPWAQFKLGDCYDDGCGGVEMSQVDFYLILSVVFVVVAIGVMNTMVMSVMERTRELGVMLALGTRGSQLQLTILFEAFFLAILGMLVGTVVGGLLVVWLGTTGIDLSSISGALEAIPGITDRIYPVLIFDHVWLPSLLLFLCSVLVALYPAWRASRLDPVEAIRHG